MTDKLQIIVQKLFNNEQLTIKELNLLMVPRDGKKPYRIAINLYIKIISTGKYNSEDSWDLLPREEQGKIARNFFTFLLKQKLLTLDIFLRMETLYYNLWTDWAYLDRKMRKVTPYYMFGNFDIRQLQLSSEDIDRLISKISSPMALRIYHHPNTTINSLLCLRAQYKKEKFMHFNGTVQDIDNVIFSHPEMTRFLKSKNINFVQLDKNALPKDKLIRKLEKYLQTHKKANNIIQ